MLFNLFKKKVNPYNGPTEENYKQFAEIVAERYMAEIKYHQKIKRRERVKKIRNRRRYYTDFLRR
jgi:hypothetical protein